MSIELQAYTAEGLLSGQIDTEERLLDLLTPFGTIPLDGATLVPFGRPPQRAGGRLTVDADELLAVVAPSETVTPYHAVWNRLIVDVGPYRIRGEMPSLPGFDPGRALARPSGAFLLVGRTIVELRDIGRTSSLSPHGYLWLNRYAVDAVSSDLDLSFFFPGATSEAAHRAIAIAG